MVTPVSPRSLRFGACLLAAMLLASCGPAEEESDDYTAGGTVSGLNGTLVLAAEAARSDSIALTASGPYVFSERFERNETLTVFVYKQPLGQTCTVLGGTISGNSMGDIDDITVNCVNNPYTVGGVVTGLTSGTMALQLNLADNLTVSNGAFTFPKPLPAGAAYAVSILAGSQTTHTCVFTNGAGTANAAVTNVAIACTPLAATYALGGSLAGLAGTVTLRNSVNGETYTTNANGSFTFPTAVATGADYFVTVQTQPAGQTCAAANASGTVAPNSGIAVAVVCAAGTATHTVGGVVNGLKASMKLGILVNNVPLDVNPSGTAPVPYTFPVPLPSGAKFQVFVRSQPAGQTCIIPHSGSTVALVDITDITVVCADNITDPLTGTYMAYDGEFAMTFYANGTYVHATVDAETDCGASQGNGVEIGAYRYNATTGSLSFITNLIDTNGGSCGVWKSSGSVINNGTVVKTGAAQATVLVLTPSPGAEPVELVPVPSVANRPIGAFPVLGGPSLLVFTDDGQYLGVNANDDPAGNAPAGVEYGCYSASNAQSGTLTPVLTAGTCDEVVNTDGVAGLSGSSGVALPFLSGPGFLILNNGAVSAGRSLPN